MGIVLTILKVIGIIILILLGLVIFLASLILFVPVRYQLQLAVEQDVNAKATVSYLFHIVHLAVTYKEKEPKGTLRIFGIPVYNLFPTEEEKKKKEERERCKEEKRRKKIQKQKEKQRKKRKKQKTQSTKTKKAKIEKTTKVETKPQNQQTVQRVEENKNSWNSSVETLETTSGYGNVENKEAQEEYKKEPKGIWKKVKETYSKVKLFCEKVVDKVKNIKYTIINFKNKVKHGKELFVWYVNLFSKEESKSAIKKAKHQLGRLWKHASPQVFRGNVQFGFEDPATTGDVFSKICMIYPLYAGHVVVVPNFEERVLKGDLFLKGRIRIVVLLHIGWKILFDDEIRKFYEMCTNPKI